MCSSDLSERIVQTLRPHKLDASAVAALLNLCAAAKTLGFRSVFRLDSRMIKVLTPPWPLLLKTIDADFGTFFDEAT